MSSLKLSLLGPPRLERDGVPLELDTRKNMALIAYLAVTGESHSREALITLLWPELEPSRARAGLRRNLSVLKKALAGEWLVVDRETIGLDPSADPSACSGQALWLVVDQFRSLLRACREHDHPESDVCPECLTALAEAVKLYRGDFLAGFSLRDSLNFDEWQFFEAESLRQELASALERLVRGHSAQGAYESAIPYARRWLALDPLHETAHRCLMQLYAQAGQRAAALRQYQECVRILEAELDLPPSEETTSLYKQIRTRPADREEPLFPAPLPRHNLPAQPTPFIGREVQLATVRQELTRPEVRLLTLTGTGGTGKTRLGLQVAANLLDAFENGVFFVSLAPIRDPALVMPTIAGTLDVRQVGGRPLLELLKDYLRDKQMLLVLDNFEQVAEAGPVVGDLLAAAPRLKVLVTSRASLRVYGEHDYPVPSLALPDPKKLPPLERLTQVEAVQLFIQRARAVKAGFAITDENSSAVAEICQELDGLPLAIELAAARVRLLPPKKMLTQLGSRLRFLTGGARDLPARHQTLRGTMDWSYDLLDADEKTLFRRLAVFVGGCTLEAAEAVGNASGDPSSGHRGEPVEPSGQALDVLNGLERLVDQNLLQQSEVGGEPRFAMLETIREYALERLAESGEAEAIRKQHARFFLALAEEAEPKLYGAEQAAWLDRLEMEYNNLRAALAWSIDRAIDVGLRLAGTLGRFWHVRAKHSEGRDWLAKALAKSKGYGTDVDSFRAKALNQAGILAYFQDDITTAYALQEESVALSRELGDKRDLAQALCDLGVAVLEQGDLTQARSLIEESIALFRQIDDKSGLGRALQWHGAVAYREHDYERSRSSLGESISLAQETGDINQLAFSTGTLGHIAFEQGDYAAAQSFFEKGLILFREAKDKVGVAYALGNLGDSLYKQGNYEEAKTFYEESLELHQKIGGKSAVASMLSGLGHVSLHQNHWQQAQALFAESLALHWELGDKEGIAACLAGLAGVAERERQPERVARLLGAAEALLEASDIRLPTIIQAEYDRIVAAVRAQLDEAAFAAAWAEGRARDLEATVAELLVELGE